MMTFLTGELLDRALAATGKSIPPENSVRGLENLPQDILDDVEAIYARDGRHVNSLCLFAYLYHVTDAGFLEVKNYLDQRGWLNLVDDDV